MNERLRAAPRAPDALAVWLAAFAVTDAELAAVRIPDAAHPYGRRVLVAEPGLEAMLATWTPGATCAPHDHGGATGAVRLLRGRCVHRSYRPRCDALLLVDEREHVAGDVLGADAELVHAMQDVGDEPLVTLHVYVPAIARAVVYDVPGRRTLVVGGGHGAWVPADPGAIERALPGFVAPREALR